MKQASLRDWPSCGPCLPRLRPAPIRALLPTVSAVLLATGLLPPAVAAAPDRDKPAGPASRAAELSRAESFAKIAPQVVQVVKSGPIMHAGWDPAMSGDEAKVVLVMLDRPAPGPAAEAPPAAPAFASQVWIMNMDGSGQQTLTSGAGSRGSPVFSPKADRVLFVKSQRPRAAGELWMVNVDGSGLKKLPVKVNCLGRPAWSPDGKTIAFAFHTADRQGLALHDPEGGAIWLSPAEAGDFQALGLSWTPDSRRLLYQAGSTVYCLNAADKSIRKLLEAESFALSPDGGTVARVIARPNERRCLELVDVKSLKATKVYQEDPAGTSRLGEFAWSSEGSKLLCGCMLVDVNRALREPARCCRWLKRLSPFLAQRPILLRDGRLITQGRQSITARVLPLEEQLSRTEVWLWELDWNRLFISKEIVQAQVALAADEVAGVIRPAWAGLLSKPTKDVSAPTRLVCTELEERIYDAMLKLAFTKHPKAFETIISQSDRYDYCDPLADGAGWGFLRRLKGLEVALSGDFVRLDQSAERSDFDTVRRAWGYPAAINTSHGRLRYESQAQGVRLGFQVAQWRDDVLDLLVEQLRPFFALELLYDADRAYGIELAKSLARIKDHLSGLAARRQADLKALAGRYRLPTSGWPKHRGDLGNVGCPSGKLVPPLARKWFRPLKGSPNWTTPLLDDKYVYVCRTVGQDQATLHILDRATGGDVHKLQFTGRLTATPLLTEQRLFVLQEPRQLQAFQKTSWKPLWTTYLPAGHSEAGLTLAGGILVALNRVGFICGISPADGAILWKHRVSDAASTPVVCDDRVIYAEGQARPAALIARRLTDGQELWRRELPKGTGFFHHHALSAGKGRVFAVLATGSSGALSAFDAADGSPLWEHKIARVHDARCAACDGAVIVQHFRGSLVGLDPATGKQLWTAAIPEGRATCPPVIVGHCAVGITYQLYVLDLQSRKLLHSERLPNPAGIFAAVSYHDGTLYVVNGDDEWVLALGPKPEDERPKPKRN